MDNQYNSSCVGGAAGYIDRWILGINHIYSNPTPKAIYGSGPFDPEGILGMVY
jgi:heparan-alpha-glucosaminide N-acetyltransferase